MVALQSIVFQIVVMFVLILCGVLLYRIGWISKETNKQLSKIVVSFVNPALMFSAYNIEMQETLVRGLLQAFALAVIAHGLFIATAHVLIRDQHADQGMEKYCAIYSNCAFIGIPLVSSVYGNEGVFYVTAYITIFNLLMWSHGIILMSGAKKINPLTDILLSPTILATLLGMLVFFGQIKVPAILLQPIHYVGSMNTPLAMIVSGVTIAQSSFWKAWKDWRIYRILVIKMVVVPAILVALGLVVKGNAVPWMSTVLVAACPVATASTLLAIQYNQNEKRAAQIFGMSTLLSTITLPLLVLVGSQMG